MRRIAPHLQELLQPAVEALGYELWGIEYLSQGRHSVLRVYIESEAGIGLDDCEAVSRQVSGILDVEEPIRGQYNLEVSSPGLDRPLFSAGQFRRYAGQGVRVRMMTPVEGRRKFAGVVVAVSEDAVTIREQDGEEATLSLAAMDKANLVPEDV